MERTLKPQSYLGVKILGTYVVTLAGIGGILFLSLSLLPLAAPEVPAKAPIVSFH